MYYDYSSVYLLIFRETERERESGGVCNQNLAAPKIRVNPKPLKPEKPLNPKPETLKHNKTLKTPINP